MSGRAELSWNASGWYLGGPLLAAGAGALLAWQPLALAGIVVLVLVVRFPGLAPHVLVIGEGTMFLSRLALGSYSLATAGEYAACLAALVAAAVRSRDFQPIRVYAGSIALLSPWLIYGIGSYGAAQALTGLRLTTLPVLAVALGLRMDRAALGRLLGTGSVVLLANAAGAWWERRLGVEGLIASGISYGDQITEIGNDVLRAPGLMRNSFHLGLFAGAFTAVVALAVFVAEERLSRIVYLVGVPSAIACLLLSTSRTSLVAVVVSALLCVQMSDASTRMGRASRASAAFVLPLLPLGVVLMGADSSGSLFARLSVWGSFFGSRLDLLGHGLGSVGAASFSQFSSSDKVFVDNYWLSIAYQFGGLALLVVYLGTVVLLVAVLGRRISTRPHRAMAALMVTLAAASMLLEVWEYPGAMALFGLAFGHWWTSSRSPGPQPPDQDGRGTGEHLSATHRVPQNRQYVMSGALPLAGPDLLGRG